MKINIACPTTGGQKVFDFDDEKKLRAFMELRISDEVDASSLGDEFKGYILRITGGNDKDGFPMKQGVLVNHRVRLLLKPGAVGFRRGRHDGVRRRRTVRGCIIANDLSVINTIVVKKGEQEIPGLTDKVIPRRVGPKRASKIRKLFNLSHKDDVCKYVIGRKVASKKEGGKDHIHKPKIQRLVTSRTIHNRRRLQNIRVQRRAKARAELVSYNQLIRERAAAVVAAHAAQAKAKAKQKKTAKKKTAVTKLARMLVIRQAMRDARAAKYKKRLAHMNALRAANARHAEFRKTHPKLKLTPEQIKKKMRPIIARRWKKWNEGARLLRAARNKVLRKWNVAKREALKAREVLLKARKEPFSVRRKIQKNLSLAESKIRRRPALLTKKGAARFLGDRAKPDMKWSRKMRIRKAKRLARRAKNGAPTTTKPPTTKTPTAKPAAEKPAKKAPVAKAPESQKTSAKPKTTKDAKTKGKK